jgi:hypothetical protein
MARLNQWVKATILLFACCLLFRVRGVGLSTESPGYLPVVGPVPVRFQIHAPVMPAVLWPPLIQPEKRMVANEVQLTNPPAAEAPATESPAMTDPFVEAVAAPPATPPPPAMVIPFPIPAPIQSAQVTDRLIDLQTQLNYLLLVSTNEPGAKVIMPLFVPPPPPPNYPSSHATYESQ